MKRVLSMKSVLLFGASGLTGQHCLQLLLENDHYQKVLIAVRAPLSIQHKKLSQVVVDFSDIESNDSLFDVDEVFCCIGTTIKKAGSKAAFNSIDHNLVVNIAKLAKSHAVKKFLVISALGASPNSRSFYNQTKGKMEANLKSLNMNDTYVFRPSLLLGDRQEYRFAEQAAAMLCKVIPFWGPLKALEPISASILASAMVNVANTECLGSAFQIIENQDIKSIAKQ